MKKNLLLCCYNIGVIAIFMFYITSTWINWSTDFILTINSILLKVGVILPIIGLIMFGYQTLVHRSTIWYLSTINMASLSIVMLVVSWLFTSSSTLLTSGSLKVYMIILLFAYAILMTIGIKYKKNILRTKSK